MKVNYRFNFLLSPFVISLFITIGIVIFSPNLFSKYEINLIKDEPLASFKKIVHADIDNDQKSEKFVLRGNQENNNASYILFNNDGGLIGQYNLSTRFSKYKNIWFQDSNNNGVKELYIITKSNDSIFLNIHEHILENKIWEEKIFIDKIGIHKNRYDFVAITHHNYFDTENSAKEIVFGINTGYGKTPRSIYTYNHKTKEVKKSPHLTNSISSISAVVDLDNDGKNEILINNFATSNNLDTKKTDTSSWLLALDDDLKPLFEPSEIKSKGRIKSTYLKDGSNTYIIYFFQSQDRKLPSKLIKTNFKGDVLDTIVFLDNSRRSLGNLKENVITVYNKKNGVITFYNIDFEVLNTYELNTNLSLIQFYDFDNDGEKEWITKEAVSRKITIYRKDFSHPVVLEIPYLKDNNFGVELINENKTYLFFNEKSKLSYYEYVKNDTYILKYLFYIILYLLVLVVVLIIAKGQELRDDRKKEIEKKILELQLKNIKNQVDSHFVFNALNTISEMSLSENKLEVDSFITGYSKFMRTTLEHSDKISTSIKEELSYVENFIELQQLKLKNNFSYKIDVHDSLETSIQIPKHCIFTYVENAIKYGIPKDDEGFLQINLKLKNQKIIIHIKDNGEGLSKSLNADKKGTGKGLQIMNTVFELYKKRYKTEIEHSIENVVVDHKISGVLVIIKIKQNVSKSINNYG